MQLATSGHSTGRGPRGSGARRLSWDGELHQLDLPEAPISSWALRVHVWFPPLPPARLGPQACGRHPQNTPRWWVCTGEAKAPSLMTAVPDPVEILGTFIPFLILTGIWP